MRSLLFLSFFYHIIFTSGYVCRYFISSVVSIPRSKIAVEEEGKSRPAVTYVSSFFFRQENKKKSRIYLCCARQYSLLSLSKEYLTMDDVDDGDFVFRTGAFASEGVAVK